MKLKKVSITGFRSIKKTEDLLLDDRINVLIGANDHGKTNLIEAMRRLNDEFPITANDKNWDLETDRHPRIEWWFHVTPDELKSYFSPDSTESEPISCFPSYGNDELVFYREGIDSPVKIHSVPGKILTSREAELLSLRPRVELFEAPRANLVDGVNHEQLMSPQYEFMQGIFMLAGIWENRASIFTENDVNSKLLDEASVKLNQAIKEKWNQGKDLTWKLKPSNVNGNSIEIKIEDPAVKNRYIRPSLKSSGFQTYFLISMIILARTQSNKGKFIFLFDEPGTYLHPYAQLDLQRTFELISDHAQIIYTTHSLFLINKNYPARNKVISKSNEGTKIDQKPFQKNWKSVRDSLGILLSNNFLIAEKSLLVEGPSDIIYILDALRRFKIERKFDLDLNDLSVVDAGAPDNYIAMAKVMLSEGRDVVALLDGDKSGDDTKRKLERICVNEIKDGRLKIIQLAKSKSIEDIFAELATLRQAIKLVADSVVESGERKYKDGALKAIESITVSDEKTLGKVIDEVTSSLFEESEKLSKLSIALQYEDLAKEKQFTLEDNALGLLKKIKTDLAVRGERSAEPGVFEEVGDKD